MISLAILLAGLAVFVGTERVRRALVQNTTALNRDAEELRKVLAHLDGEPA